MFFLAFGLILFVTAVVCALVMKKKLILLGIPCALIVCMMGCFTSVPAGYTGIVTTFGRVEDKTLEAGFHMKAPWQTVVTMDNREQRVRFTLEAFSSDIQQVKVTASINFSIDKSTAMTLYRNVGTNYAEILITPRLHENTKSVFSRYTAESLVEQRTALSGEVLAMMRSDLSSYGLNIVNVAIENIDFTDAFTDAVEAKQVATQTYQRAQTEQQQQTMEASQAAERLRIQAQADADVARIQAEAAQYAGEREAEMNRKLSESLTPELVQYYYAQRWNGVLPTTWMGSGDMIPLISIPTTPNE